ncbi:MAG: hypothetical protein J7L11_03265 [Thermoprotei archaeon]|nr:hypothetical protein [Thermoprotei archaeon]
MKKHRRSRLRVMVDIMRAIRACSNEARITWIMRDANLPYDRLLNYLAELERRGLVIRKSDNSDLYHLTKKGMKFLIEFEKVERFARVFGLEL